MTKDELQAKREVALSELKNIEVALCLDEHYIDIIEKENAELKEDRPQWHDLRKDPNDLPPKMLVNSNFSIDVLSDKGEIVCYNFHYCEWFYWRSRSPIAWCEIPTFDKE